MIYLTSFFKAYTAPDVEVFSAAVYQPKGFSFPKAEWTDIRDADGKWIRPRNFIHYDNPREAYRDTLLALYQSRASQVDVWLDQHMESVLCCWCPRDKAAQRQLKDWGSFICHTSVIAEFITEGWGIPVWLDADRLNMTVLGQKGLTV